MRFIIQATVLAAASMVWAPNEAGAQHQELVEATQRPVTSQRLFATDTCPVINELEAIRRQEAVLYSGAKERSAGGAAVLGFGAQFLSNMAGGAWNLLGGIVKNAGRPHALFEVSGGSSYPFYLARAAGGDKLSFEMDGSQYEGVERRFHYRCLVLVAGRFGYAGPGARLDPPEVRGPWAEGRSGESIMRTNAGDTLLSLGIYDTPDVYVESIVIEDSALGAMRVQPVYVWYNRPHSGLRPARQRRNDPQEAALVFEFLTQPQQVSEAPANPNSAFAVSFVSLGPLVPGSVLGPMELSGASVGALPMRSTNDNGAVKAVEEDFKALRHYLFPTEGPTAATGEEASRSAAEARYKRWITEGAPAGPVWVQGTFQVLKPGNSFLALVGEAMQSSSSDLTKAVQSDLAAQIADSQARAQEDAGEAFELAMLQVALAKQRLEGAPDDDARLVARAALISAQYDARRAARRAGRTEPSF